MWPRAFTIITDIQTNHAIFTKQCHGFTSNPPILCQHAQIHVAITSVNKKALLLRSRTKETVCMTWDKAMYFSEQKLLSYSHHSDFVFIIVFLVVLTVVVNTQGTPSFQLICSQAMRAKCK